MYCLRPRSVSDSAVLPVVLDEVDVMRPYLLFARFMCGFWWFWEDVSEIFWPGNSWYPSCKWESYLPPSQELIDAIEGARQGNFKKFDLGGDDE